MFLHSTAMSEGAAGLTPRIDLCSQVFKIQCLSGIVTLGNGKIVTLTNGHIIW